MGTEGRSMTDLYLSLLLPGSSIDLFYEGCLAPRAAISALPSATREQRASSLHVGALFANIDVTLQQICGFNLMNHGCLGPCLSGSPGAYWLVQLCFQPKFRSPSPPPLYGRQIHLKIGNQMTNRLLSSLVRLLEQSRTL